MSDFYASANGLRVTWADVSVPYYGAPVADITIAGADALAPRVDLVIGNLTLKMAVLRQRAFAGSTSARLVGGAGGWGKLVPARAYQNPDGVPLASILRDVSLGVGESVTVQRARIVGAFYAREAAPAERVLRQLAGALWWVDPAGVTQVGSRVASKIKTAASVEDIEGGKGWLSVATEDPAAWLPGATYASPTVPGGLTVSATRFAMGDAGKLRLMVLTVDSVIAGGAVTPDNVTPADRAMAALRSIMRSEDPGRVPGGGPWEYQIERADAATFDGSPTSQDFPLPPLVMVPYSPALAGTSCVPVKGTLAYVDFVNRDPTRPLLRGFGTTLPKSSALDATDTIEVGPTVGAVVLAGGGPAVAREGDNIAGGSFSALGVTIGAPIQFIYTPYHTMIPNAPGPVVIVTGKITSGSSKVTSG